MSADMGAMHQTLETIGKTNDLLFDTANKAVSALNDLGMTNTAASVKNTAQKTNNACKSTVNTADQNIMLMQWFTFVHDYLDSIKTKFSPPLAKMSAAVEGMDGRMSQNWKGDGASAYKDHADLQVKASSELSESALKIAHIILENFQSAEKMNDAMNAAMITFAASLIAGIPALIPPATAVGITILCTAVAAILVAVITIINAYNERKRDLESMLEELTSLASGDGSTVFDGHWPSRQLYGEG